MGNAVHWLIFLGLATSSIALVTYSLVGKIRSFVIALPVAGIFSLMVYATVMAQRIPAPRVLTIFLLVGSGLGLLRQFSRKGSRDNTVNQ